MTNGENVPSGTCECLTSSISDPSVLRSSSAILSNPALPDLPSVCYCSELPPDVEAKSKTPVAATSKAWQITLSNEDCYAGGCCGWVARGQSVDLWIDHKFKACVSYSSRNWFVGAKFQRQLELTCH
jgi:hypothetical protein